MPLDLNYILSIRPEQLNDEEKDELYNNITWLDLETEEIHVEHYKDLLVVSQEILKYKGEQVETLLHELDEVAVRQGEEEAERLESDVDPRKSRKSSAIEIENLEQKYVEMKSKFKKQQRLNQKNLQEIEQLTKTLKSLEMEKRQLEQDLATKMDGSESSELSETVKDQHKELVETVHNKNKQLSDLLRDIEEVEKDNIVLKEKLTKVRDELAVATSDIERQSETVSSLNLKLADAQETIRRVKIDNELLQEELQELNVLKTKMEERLMEFADEINKRVDELQRVLMEKEAEIEELKSKTSLVRVSSPSSEELGQTHSAALQKLLMERDSQLLEVQSKLEDGVREMEVSTRLIEDLKKEKEDSTKTIHELNAMAKELKKQLKVTHERCQKLQEEVEGADKMAEGKTLELQEIIERLEGSNRLDEAQMLKQIHELKTSNRLNEKHITSLVKSINNLQDTCDQLTKENQFLRGKLGIPEEDILDIPHHQNKQKQYKKELLRLKKKILHYEEENILLRTEVKNLNRVNALLKDELSEGEILRSSISKEVTPKESKPTVVHSSKDQDKGDLSLGEVVSENEGKLGVMEGQFKALCEENEALRKGMHEILNTLNSKKENSLKEIKSETFEKLLRALDVKHLSGWYHPAMRMQAEVHNVEGINKELREQLRICRIELEELRNKRQENLILLSKRTSVSSPRHVVQSSAVKDMRTLDSLNENVDQLLERTTTDAKVCQEIADKMSDFNRDFSSLEKQLDDLYRQSLEEKKISDERLAEVKKKNSELEGRLAVLEEQLKVFMEDEKVEDTLKKIASLTGAVVEADMKRNYLEIECRKMEEEVDELKKKLKELELEGLKNLGEFKGIEKFLRNRIKSLEVELEGVVCYEDHQKLKKELDDLMVKYRGLMEDYKRLGENHHMELEMLKRSKQMTDDEKLELVHKLNDCLTKLNLAEPVNADENLENLARKVSEMEVSLMGERQRANHVNNLYELVKEQLNKSEERLREYETRTKDIMRKNLELQGQLKEAEDKLCSFVDLEIFNATKEECRMAMQKQGELLQMVEKLEQQKLVSETDQRGGIVWTSSKEEELLALKHQLVDLSVSSDDKAVIARISSDLTRCRSREKELIDRCDVLSGQLEQCHEEWLDSLRTLDEEKEKCEKRLQQLQKKNRLIQDLLENQKLQYYGSIPMISEQRFIENLKLTLENNHTSFVTLHKAQNVENDSLTLKELVEAELRHYSEAKAVLSENEEEKQKLFNWMQEKKNIELELIRYRRQAEFKDLQLQQCNDRIEMQNNQIAKLEEDLFLSLKGQDLGRILPVFPEPEPSTGEIAKSTKNQDVQTELIERDEGDGEARRFDSLKIELLNTKNEVSAREEDIRALKTKLNECEMTVSLFRTQIGDKQAQISFYEKHILDLQQSKKEDAAIQRTLVGPGGDGASVEVANEDVLSLQLKALQEAVASKDESILNLQSLLKEDRDNHSLAAARMQEELKTLKVSLVEEKQKRAEFEQLNEEMSRGKMAVEQYIKQVHAMEKHGDELHTQVSTLESQLTTSRQEAVRWRSLANDRLKAIEELRQSLEGQHKEELEIYKRDSEKWREEVLSLKELINKHKNEVLQVQPDLHDLLRAKDDKINELTVLLRQVREELQHEYENDAYSRQSETERAHAQLLKEHEILKRKFDASLKREREAKEEVRDLRGQLLKSKRTPSSARSEKSDKSIKDQLQKKVSNLEDEVARLKDELSVQMTINEGHRVKAAEDFDRWKKQKQTQQTIDKLKSKLKEKDGEFERIQHTCSGYRSLIERLEREKHSLENRVKALKANVNVFGFENSTQNESLALENAKLMAEVQELKLKLEMQQRHSGGLGATMMQEKLEAQERKLAIMELSGKGTPEIRAEFERFQSAISNLQKTNLCLEAHNMELKMDLEKSQKDFSRFKDQIHHLENYIVVLKKERCSQSADNAGPTTSEARRVNELERTVLALKRVVEKLQTENKRLTAGRRPVADRSMSGEKLRKDYNWLKEQYNESVLKISELQSVLNSTDAKSKSGDDTEGFLALSAELNRTRAQLDQKSQLLDRVKVLLQNAAAKEKDLLKQISELKMQAHSKNDCVGNSSISHV